MDAEQPPGPPAEQPSARPPDIDADYRVVHGPWPRWALQLGLLHLALRTAGIVVALCLLALGIAIVVTRL